MNEIKKVLGKSIRDAREEKGITQKELGSVLGYSPMGISHFEKGIRELKMTDVQKISEYFGKNISYFLKPEAVFFRADQSGEDVSQVLADFDAFLDKQNL